MVQEEILRRSGFILGDIILLGIAYGILSISLWHSWVFNDGQWLQRSGSLVVIFGVILEYRFFIVQQKLNEIAQASTKHYGAQPEKYRLPKSRRVIGVLTHFTLLLGTLLWGYGDLLFDWDQITP